MTAGDRTSACVGNRGHGTAHSHTPGCGQLKQRKTLLKTTVRARGGGGAANPALFSHILHWRVSLLLYFTLQSRTWAGGCRQTGAIVYTVGFGHSGGLLHGSCDSPARAVGLTQGASPGGEGQSYWGQKVCY